jgi:hypothetical protein
VSTGVRRIYLRLCALSWGNHLHDHRPLVDPILCRISVPYPTGIFTLASGHGHLKASQVCLRRSIHNIVAPSFSERVGRNRISLVYICLSYVASQVVFVHCHCYVCLQIGP